MGYALDNHFLVLCINRVLIGGFEHGEIVNGRGKCTRVEKIVVVQVN